MLTQNLQAYSLNPAVSLIPILTPTLAGLLRHTGSVFHASIGGGV
jgi:hypothetical protein